MLHLPKRTSLIAETADALREAIESGVWQEALPGERELADRFQVSRPTLREALKILQKEKVIDVAHGKRRTIVPGERSPLLRSRRVTAISQHPPHQMSPLIVFYMNELRRHIQNAGLELEIIADHRLRGAGPEDLLEQLTRTSSAACWLLLSVSETVQRWFDTHGLPAIVVGSCFPGVNLPSLDLDYRAVCRHAAGVLLGQGHRNIAFLAQTARGAGDEASEEGFLQAAQQSGHADLHATIAHHDGTRHDICRKLERLMRPSSRPTALLVSRPMHFLTAHTFLLQNGTRFPQDLSLISRDNDTYLAQLVPDPARYIFRRRHFASRMGRLVIQMATAGSVPKRQFRIVPQFHPGETVGPPRA